MAGKGPLLNSLATLVAGFDIGAWEALANKGLVRRAQKDLEAGLKIEVEEETDAIRFKIAPYEITMPAAGPAKASCTCPARGVCQHIIAAGMWLQKMAREDSPQAELAQPKELLSREEIEKEVLALTLENLEKWAGVAALREGRQLAGAGKIEPASQGTLVVDFPDKGAKARFVPGGGLDGIIVSGAARARQQAVAVAAVLCVHLAHGKLAPEEVAASKALEEAAQAPRTRDEILEAVSAVIEEALQVGLAHVSSSLKERLQTLGMSAQATNLPRLARMLRALADETAAIVERLGRASEAGLLLAMARAHALAHALKDPSSRARSDLVGVHRTQYEELSRLDLLGAAAYPWQTASGYLGLTVLYWEPAAKAWYSWSDARPITQAAGFNPLNRFQGSGPWEGIESPEESARSRMALVSPRRNPEGRLSSSSSTKGMILGAVTASEFDFGGKLFSDWPALRAYIARVFPIGLREMHPLDLIVVLQPRKLGRRYFDEQKQLFQWEIFDGNNASFLLAVPYRDWTAQAIKFLEDMNSTGESQWRFVARIFPSEIGIAAEPLALHRIGASDGAIVHLAFSAAGKKAPKTSVLNAVLNVFRENDDDWDEEEEAEETVSPIPRVVENLLGRIEKTVERTSESGIASLDMAALASLAKDAQRLGMIPLAKTLGGPATGPADMARMILKVRYICSLYRQSAVFA
ncbi:MAG TPA: hypothetical protein VG733_19135 [Chthoniobacteraceae bacterium]|nr:hypothetical protein [Chthoniobacteraceae bacterium]